MVFVWSDDLALLLRDAGHATTGALSHWIASPIAYRLPDGEDPLDFALDLLEDGEAAGRRRRAS